MEQESVVVTGIGVVSPFGKGKKQFVNALKNGTLGKSKVTRFDVSDPHYAHPYACNVKDDLEENLTEVDDSKISTITLWAAQEALQESKISLDDFDRYRVGMSLGTSHGGNHSLIKFLKQRWKINNQPVDYSLIFNTSATVGGGCCG